MALSRDDKLRCMLCRRERRGVREACCIPHGQGFKCRSSSSTVKVGRNSSFQPQLEQMVAHKNADVGNLDASRIMWS